MIPEFEWAPTELTGGVPLVVRGFLIDQSLIKAFGCQDTFHVGNEIKMLSTFSSQNTE
jgi:hypothetical protein